MSSLPPQRLRDGRLKDKEAILNMEEPALSLADAVHDALDEGRLSVDRERIGRPGEADAEQRTPALKADFSEARARELKRERRHSVLGRGGLGGPRRRTERDAERAQRSQPRLARREGREELDREEQDSLLSVECYSARSEFKLQGTGKIRCRLHDELLMRVSWVYGARLAPVKSYAHQRLTARLSDPIHFRGMRLFIFIFIVIFSAALGLNTSAYADREGESESRDSPTRRWVSGFGHRIWAGQTVEPPLSSPRPDARPLMSSSDGSVTLHASPTLMPEPAALQTILSAVEEAARALPRLGFARPIPDGGRGGTQGFDLYLVDEPMGADAKSDGLELLGPLDGAIAHGLLGADVPAHLLSACAVDAYAQAALLGLDPAESRRIRRALAAYLAYKITGIAGCEDAIDAWQFAPEQGPFSELLYEGAGGALFLLLLDSRWRADGRTPAEILSLARQLSWERHKLRASPDYWEAIETITASRQERFLDLLVGISVERLFTGDYARRPELSSIPSPHSFRRGRPRTYSFHTSASPRGVAPGGAIHAEFSLEGFKDGDALNLWVDGEYGFRLTLAAIALDAEGRELRRFISPPGASNHRAFVPFVYPEGAASIRLIGISLGFERPDEDLPPPVARRARFILERPDEP